ARPAVLALFRRLDVDVVVDREPGRAGRELERADDDRIALRLDDLALAAGVLDQRPGDFGAAADVGLVPGLRRHGRNFDDLLQVGGELRAERVHLLLQSGLVEGRGHGRDAITAPAGTPRRRTPPARTARTGPPRPRAPAGASF